MQAQQSMLDRLTAAIASGKVKDNTHCNTHRLQHI